jgi:hypothetical protein
MLINIIISRTKTNTDPIFHISIDALMKKIKISEKIKQTKEIKVYIKSSDKTQIPINLIASYFETIQNIMYLLADQIEGNKYRIKGDYPQKIKERCELVIKDVKLESFDATVQLSDFQSALPLDQDTTTFGERTISLADQVVKVIITTDDIFPQLLKIIPDPERATRCLKDWDSIWQDDKSKYSVEVSFGQDKIIKLDPKVKPKIRDALDREIIASEKILVGRLVELNVTKKHSCQIETPEGKFNCIYKPDLEDVIKEKTGKFVSVVGNLKDSRTFTIESESSIKTIHSIPIKHIFIDNQIKDLKKEIVVSIDYNKIQDKYVLGNEKLNIFAINRQLNLAVDDIQEQIWMLWQGYVEEDILNLTDSAIKFRKMLIDFVGE